MATRAVSSGYESLLTLSADGTVRSRGMSYRELETWPPADTSITPARYIAWRSDTFVFWMRSIVGFTRKLSMQNRFAVWYSPRD